MRGRVVMFLLSAAWLAAPAYSETGLVMKDGSVVKCESYELKGNVYILKAKDGKKVSLRADKVDPAATAEFARKAEAMNAAKAALDAQAAAEAKPAPTMAAPGSPAASTGGPMPTLTDADLDKYRGQPSSMGDQSTVTAETPEMPSREDYEKLEGEGSAPAGGAAAPKGEKGASPGAGAEKPAGEAKQEGGDAGSGT